MEAGVNNRPGKKQLLAISWCMPPLVFPRSIQVARTLLALDRLGWKSTVLHADLSSIPIEISVDQELENLYAGAYVPVAVPMPLRVEEDQPSDPLMLAWKQSAIVAARTRLKTGCYHILATFAQPWVGHLVGLALKDEFNLPWLAHFSDPWVDNLYNSGTDPRILDRWRKYEAKVVARADALVFTNEQARTLVMGKYPPAWAGKAFVVPHGFDPRLNDPAAQLPGNKTRLRLVYTGNLYKERSVQSLLDVLVDLGKTTDLKESLELEIIGPTENIYSQKVREMGLEGVVNFPGRMPYLESLRALAQADVLVVIEAPNAVPNPFLPSKLVDYLMFDKPILALSPQVGATADLLKQLGYPIVPPDDRMAIKQVIAELFVQWRDNKLCPSDQHRSVAARYDIASTTRVLNAILCDLVSRPPAKMALWKRLWFAMAGLSGRKSGIKPSGTAKSEHSSARPKLCFVSLYSYPLFNATCVSPFGGSEVRVSRIAKTLAKRGCFDVSLIVFDHGQAEVEIRDSVTLYAWRGRPCPLNVKPSLAVGSDQHTLVGTVPERPGPVVQWARKHIPRLIRNAISWGILLPHTIAEYLLRAARALACYLDLQVKRCQAIGRIGPHLVLSRNVMIYNKVNADIYVLPGNNEMAAEMALFCAKRNKTYVMLAGSDIDFDPAIKKNPSTVIHYGVFGYLKLYAIQQARAFVVQSEAQAELLKRTFGKEAVVVRNPVDINPAFPRTSEPSRILWVGKSDMIKRPDLAIDLAAIVREAPFMLIMTLSDPAIHQQCGSRGAALGNVSFVDYVVFEEIEKYFADTKVLINTSEFEGFPNAFLQAAKYGVPIVSLRVDPGGMLSKHGCGFVCTGSMDTMCDAVRRLLADKQLYAEKSANCLRYVREFHDKDKIAAQYEDIFLDLAAGRTVSSSI